MFIKTVFMKNKKYKHGGQLNVRNHVLFYKANSCIFALRQKFHTVKSHGHTYEL
jgi:hypothetical protein